MGVKMKQKIKSKLWLSFPTFAMVYLIWRIGWTIPYDHGASAIMFSVILLLSEVLGIGELIVHFYTVSDNQKKMPKKLENISGNLPDIDVFIPTLNESVELLRQTLTACLAMKYDNPKKVHIYLCDDGDRQQMRELATSLELGKLLFQQV